MAAGTCVMTADAVFDQDDDGIVVLTTDHLPGSHENAVRNAVRMCPAGTLRVVAD